MRLIAHRGFASVNPENTLRAVENAAAVADEIEIDVRRCASGELVVIHDSTVDRVTDAHGAVREYTQTDLQSMRVLGTEAGIPTLATVLDSVPDRIGINVELKEHGLAIDALRLINALHPNALVSSFLPDALADCRAADPTVPRAYLTDGSGSEGLETAIELDCAFLHPSVEICTDRLVNEAQRAGIQINAWTIETAEEAASLSSVGVDGVIADRPDVLSVGS